MTTVLAVVLAGLIVLACWLGIVTIALLRWRHERGVPVYRRLRDGRVRFELAVGDALPEPAPRTPATLGDVE
jgi:hypothetical protein